jgi:transcriptional regulator with XRE-family HTH domain
MRSFGEALKAARVAKMKTLRELGAHVGFSVGYISDIEHGRKGPPDLETVRKMQEYLGVMDNSLINIASRLRTRIPVEITQLIQNKPHLSEILTRLGDLSDEEYEEWVSKLPSKED